MHFIFLIILTAYAQLPSQLLHIQCFPVFHKAIHLLNPFNIPNPSFGSVLSVFFCFLKICLIQSMQDAAASPVCLLRGFGGKKDKTNSKTSTKSEQKENKTHKQTRIFPAKSISFKANESISAKTTCGSLRCKSINTHFKKS